MNQTQLAKRQERSTNETFVIQRVEEGLRVYAPGEPKDRYIVNGSPEEPQCTCPDFQYHRGDPEWRCKHILAVLKEFSDIEVVPQGTDTIEVEERRAIQEEGKKPRRPRTATSGNGSGKSGNGAALTLKRSVSPDGRIDSLSVEFSSPVDTLSADAIVERARDILGMQTAIVQGFRNDQPSRNGNNHAPNGQPQSGHPQNGHPQNGRPQPPLQQPPADSNESAAVPARVLGVAGMDGKWGRRLFLTIEADGKIHRLFGKANDLAQHLASIGFTGGAQNVAEGLALNLPCRITTKPSPDGRFQNVDRLLPAARPQGNARAWR
jgi:predicted nucleic acid-binding Zn finger protein